MHCNRGAAFYSIAMDPRAIEIGLMRFADLAAEKPLMLVRSALITPGTRSSFITTVVAG